MAYIPRSSLGGEAESAIPLQARKRRSIQIVSLVSTVLFVSSSLFAVGAYLYKDFRGGQLDAAKLSLGAASSADDPKEKIADIRQYNKKLIGANELLRNHMAPSRIFEFLEEITKKTVQFSGFNYAYDPGFDAELTLIGTTEAFASIVSQKVAFNNENPFSDFTLNDIHVSEGTGESGKAGIKIATTSVSKSDVGFTIKGLFKERVIEYTGASTTATISKTNIGKPTADSTSTSSSTPIATSTTSPL